MARISCAYSRCLTHHLSAFATTSDAELPLFVPFATTCSTVVALFQLRDRGAEHLQARLDIGPRIIGVGLVLDANVAGELDLAQGAEHGRHVEGAAAEYHVGALLIVVILQVHAEVARPHVPHLL